MGHRTSLNSNGKAKAVTSRRPRTRGFLLRNLGLAAATLASSFALSLPRPQPVAVVPQPPSRLATTPVPLPAASYAGATEYAAGSSPSQVATGDLNGDGKQDLVVSNGGGISVLLGRGDGTVQAAVQYSLPVAGGYLVLADLNGDQKLDALVAQGTSGFAVLLGRGDGTFGTATTFTADGGVNSIAVGDLNGDGKLDVATGDNLGGGYYSVLLGNGDGTFGAATTVGPIVANRTIFGVTLADLDRDGKLDLVAADGADGAADSVGFQVMFGHGDGSFGSPTFYWTGNTYQSDDQILVGDVDGDSYPDIVAVDFGCGYGDGNVVVYRNSGTGAFASTANLGDGCLPGWSSLTDVNKDGHLDIVTVNGDSANDANTYVRTFLGNGDGTFQSRIVTSTTPGYGSKALAMADLNGDGKPDAITANGGFNVWGSSNDISILLNTSPMPVGGPIGPHEYDGCGCHKHQAQGFVAKPVDTATGNFYHTFTDLAIPGRGPALDFTHTYNSDQAAWNGALGYGWTFSYDMSLAVDPTSGAVTVTAESGGQDTFSLAGGVYSAPPRANETLVKNADGSYTLTRNQRQTDTFNASGQLTSITDLNGYSTTLGYNAGGQLSSITDPAGRAVTVGWLATHISTLTDVAGREVQFQYNDGAGNLTDVIDVNGGHTHLTYDGNHLLLTMADPRNATVTNHYDASQRVDYQLDALNRETTFQYTVSGPSEATTVTDPKGNVTVDYYVYGVLLQETRGYGTSSAATTSYTRDPASLGATTVTDPDGHTWHKTYDAAGNLLTSTDPLNHTTTNTYDSLNDLMTTTDPLNVTTTNTYDAKGNLLTTSRPLVGSNPAQVQTTTYTYGDAAHPGDVTSMKDPGNNTWMYFYDQYGDRTSVWDPLTDITTYTYNQLGWLTSTVTPRGNQSGSNPADFTTTYSYADPQTGVIDEFGDVRTVTDPLGHQTLTSYDADRNVVGRTDADGNSTSYTYDLDNELTDTARADGTHVRTDYNPDSSILDQVDGANNATTYAYDPLGRVSSVTDPLGRATSYTYDGNGNQLTKLDPVSGASCTASPQVGCTTDGYDAANRLTSITYSDGSTPNVTMGYDADGQRTAMTDGTGSSSWVWDSLHRMTSSTDGAGNTVGYGYDLRGLLTSLAYPGEATPVAYSYDAAGRMRGITDFAGGTTYISVDDDGNVSNMSLPSPNQGIDFWTYDNADRLATQSYTIGNGSPYVTLSYSRDPNGQLTSETDTGLPAPTSPAYTYTPLNQVASAGGASYTYDAADNPTQLANGATQGFDAANELCGTQGNLAGTCPTGSPYTYDSRGDRIQEPFSPSLLSLGWDQAGRLQGATGGTWNQLNDSYNGDGLLTKEVVGGGRLAVTHPYTWDVHGSLPLMLSDGTARYIYGPGGLPLEQVTSSATYYYHHDQLGSTRALTDVNGIVVATYTFDAYGNLSNSTGTVSNPLQYAGQDLDSQTGLYYLRARYYDPSTAQFLSRDPLSAKTGQPYAYAYDSALNLADPTGLDGCDWWNVVCQAAAAGSALASDARQAWDATGGQVVHDVQDFLNSSHTLGVCATIGGGGFGVGGSVQFCPVVRFNGLTPVGFGTTETISGGGAVGFGVTGTLDVQVSNADSISSLGKEFAALSVGGGAGWAAQGSLAAGFDDCNRFVAVANVGVGVGAGVWGQVGVSYTWTQTWLGS